MRRSVGGVRAVGRSPSNGRSAAGATSGGMDDGRRRAVKGGDAPSWSWWSSSSVSSFVSSSVSSSWRATRGSMIMMRRMPRATATRAVVVALALMTRATVANAGFTLAPTSDASAPGVTYAGSASFRAVTRDAAVDVRRRRARGVEGATASRIVERCSTRAGGVGRRVIGGVIRRACLTPRAWIARGTRMGTPSRTPRGTCATPTSETFSRAGCRIIISVGASGATACRTVARCWTSAGCAEGTGARGMIRRFGLVLRPRRGAENTLDLCCVCVDPESYYPNGVKPDAHVQIESLWKQGQRAFGEAQALMEDFKTLSLLKRRDPRHEDLHAEAKQAYDDAWALVEEQRASDTTMCYPTPSSATGGVERATRRVRAPAGDN